MKNMSDDVVIVRMESQAVVTEKPQQDGGHTTTIRNIGYDKDGQRWEFLTVNRTNRDGRTTIGRGFSYKQA